MTTCAGTSKQDPPQIPLINGVAPKQKKREWMDDDDRSVKQTIISTATALVKAALYPSQPQLL